MSYISPRQVLANISNFPDHIIACLKENGFTIIPTRDAALLAEMNRLFVALGNIAISVPQGDTSWKELVAGTPESDAWRARQKRDAA